MAAGQMIEQTVQSHDTMSARPGEIRFVRPIPGFSGLQRWTLAAFRGEESSALWELVSLDRPAVRFVVATAYGFFPHYDIDLDDEVCEDLHLADASDALVLVVLTTTHDPSAITANLLAPIVINARTRDAAQVILSGAKWPVRAPLG